MDIFWVVLALTVSECGFEGNNGEWKRGDLRTGTAFGVEENSCKS